MDNNLRSTILACIFTLLLSISTAYGILKLDDATTKRDVVALQLLHKKDIAVIEKRMNDERFFITATLERQIANSDRSMQRLDSAMIKFTTRVEEVSNTMARLDERLKSLESGRRH